MILDNKTKKYFKIICLVLFVVALTGCTANLDSSGKLIAKRAINLNTPWTMKSGIFDFLLVIPISKSIIYLFLVIYLEKRSESMVLKVAHTFIGLALHQMVK